MLMGPQVEIQGVSLVFFILQLLHLSTASTLLGKRNIFILSRLSQDSSTICTVKLDQYYNPLPPASVYVSYSHREERLRERKAEGSSYKYSRKRGGVVIKC
jgi:hypothetical protein